MFQHEYNEQIMENASDTHVKDGIIDFIAGSLGGIALVYVGQPFDTIKVKMQTFPTMYTNMFHCFASTFKNDGIVRGLYAGTVPSLAANIAENSVLFAGYGFCQKIIMNFSKKQNTDELTIVQNGLAGFLAAFGSSLTLCPTELVKCKLQAMREMNKLNPNASDQPRIGPLKLTQRIIRTEGIRGLFHGLNATIAREMPGYFFFFGGYEGMRELLRSGTQTKDEIGLLKTMVSGAVGGIVFWLVIFPADVVKSRLQVTSTRASFHRVVASIVKREGVHALYNGLLPTLCRTVPATATLFVVYEYSKKFMHYLF